MSKKIVRYLYKNFKKRTLCFPKNINEIRQRISGPKVLINSVPKSGTNLLLTLGQLIPGLIDSKLHFDDFRDRKQYVDGHIRSIRKGQFASSHLRWDEETFNLICKNNIRMLFITRDPRDIAVSEMYYLTYKSKHYYTPYLRAMANDNERLLAIINGFKTEAGRHKTDIFSNIFPYLEWIKQGCILHLRFEDLIGSTGGGNDTIQKSKLEEVYKFLSLNLTESQRNLISKKLFSTESRTFRKGQIGDWKNHFKSEHYKAFNRLSNNLLITLGYNII